LARKKKRKAKIDRSGSPDTPLEPRRYRGFDLNQFQLEAVNAIDQGRSVLVSAPTGAGKTLIAEYAVDKALAGGTRAIYTAPIKALSNQKYRDFREQLGDDVGIMTGDLTLNPSAPLMIMTTEIFRNTIFERTIELDSLEFVIFDEIHFMDDMERGTVWEESIIFAPKHIRFVCLSATIANLTEFGKWISLVRDESVEVIRSTVRPVPLTHYLFFPDFGPKRSDKVKTFPTRARSRGRGRSRSQGGRGGPNRKRHRIDRDSLLDRLQREEKLPLLYFCFSRKECETRARHNRTRRLLLPEERDEMDALFRKICERYGMIADETLEELRSLALRGVGYHHAGLLPQHKEIVEQLFTSGLLKLLFTTETFALGINMPARTVIFSSLRKFDGIGFDTLSTRQYQQMAGRAGRQGIDDDGLVYSIVEDKRVTPKDVRKLTSNDVEPIRSRFNLSYNTLINLHAHLGKEIFTAWERSFNNFQWTRMSRKKKERNRERQLSQIRKKLGFLERLEYIRDEKVTERGRVASLINGYEIQATELFFAGLLNEMDEVQINVILGSIIYEGRKGDVFVPIDSRVIGHFAENVDRIVNDAVQLERSLGIQPSVRMPDFRIASAMAAWCRGKSFPDLEEYTNASRGDLVRNFRLVIQLLKMIRKAMPSDPDLARKLNYCIDIVNRDEVDALRQLQA